MGKITEEMIVEILEEFSGGLEMTELVIRVYKFAEKNDFGELDREHLIQDLAHVIKDSDIIESLEYASGIGIVRIKEFIYLKLSGI